MDGSVIMAIDDIMFRTQNGTILQCTLCHKKRTIISFFGSDCTTRQLGHIKYHGQLFVLEFQRYLLVLVKNSHGGQQKNYELIVRFF